MNLRKFAGQLANSPEKAGDLLAHTRLSPENRLKLALALKDLYYEAWTDEPSKTHNAAEALKHLSRMHPDKKVIAVSEWVAGIAGLTIGEISQSVERLGNADTAFVESGEEYFAAQTKIGRLYGLALLGEYDEAIRCGKSALRIFTKHKDSLAIGKVHHNLGNIYDRRGLHDQAKQHQLIARKHFLEVNDLRQLSQIEHSLAITFSALNDFRRAEDFYTQALDRAKKLKMLATEAEIESTLGNHSLFRGQYAEALRYLEQSRQKYDRLKMPSQLVMAELEIADAYLELNLIDEAFEIYQRIVGELSRLQMRAEEARARTNYARTAILFGAPDVAAEQLAAAETLYKAEKNRLGMALTKISSTQLALLNRKNRSALSLIKQADAILAKQPRGKFHPLAGWLYAEVLRISGAYQEARDRFTHLVADHRQHGNPQILQSSLVKLGKIDRHLGNEAEAITNFRKAITQIETMRQPLPGEEFRMAFFADKLAPYRELTDIYIRQGKAINAFKLLERSRSRTLTDSLGSSHRLKAPSRTAAKIQREIDDLREELNWFYKRLETALPNETPGLRTELDKRERRIASLMRQSKSYERDSGGSGIELRFEELRQVLADDRALVEFTESQGRVSAFVVTRTKVRCVPFYADLSEALTLIQGLQFQFGSMRYGTSKLAAHKEQLKYRADIYLSKLYQLLIEPLEDLIGEKHLVIVPHSGMHSIPFHALRSEKKYLIEDREVSYAPSATVLQHCLSQSKRRIKKALLVGHWDEKIPQVKREIANLDRLFATNVSITGKKATIEAFKENAAKFDILHIACHGQFRLDNPMFSNLKLADGAVTALDIAKLRIKAGLVTLSACETGLNRIYAGDELLGLTRGFLSAGAGSLLMALWTVNDRAATELMTNFYAHLLKGKGLSASLRESQCNLIGNGEHPYFWSPFFLTGRW